jgi:hypothetical protein
MTPAPRDGFDENEQPTWENADDVSNIVVSSWEPIDLGPALRGEVVIESPAILARSDGAHLLYPGRTHLFIGEPEGCKSWVASCASAEELKAEHHVIYLDYEDDETMAVERLRALGVTDELIGSRFTYIRPEGRFDGLAQEALLAAIKKCGPPALVIVDAFTEAMTSTSLNPMEGPDVVRYYAGVTRWFTERGAAVVILDHVTKSTEGRGRWAIGSERKISGLDGAAYNFDVLVPFGRGKEGKIRLTVAKDRPGHVRQHTVGQVIATVNLKSWPDEGVTYSLDAPETKDGGFRPTYLMEELSKAMESNPGLSKTALRAMVKGKTDAKDLAIELLLASKYAETRPGPRNALLHYSLKPFRADDDDRDD